MRDQIQSICQAIQSPFEDTGTLTKTKEVVKRPSMYKVVLLNDDFTPMDFVVHLLQRFFNKNVDEATHIMLTIHHSGAAVCGIYTYEVAEAKVVHVMDYARQHGHPLQCTMEKD
jgi:ATP-dependent Clp protease adaptor protein ClpS